MNDQCTPPPSREFLRTGGHKSENGVSHTGVMENRCGKLVVLNWEVNGAKPTKRKNMRLKYWDHRCNDNSAPTFSCSFGQLQKGRNSKVNKTFVRVGQENVKY